MAKLLDSRLARAAAGSSGLRVASIALSFITSILLTRLLGVEGYGIYAYSISWVFLLNAIASLGCQGLLVREVSANYAKQEWGLIRGLLRWSNAVVVVTSVIVTAIFALVAFNLQEMFNSQAMPTLWIALTLVPITALTVLRQAAVQGFRYIVQGQLAETIIQPILFIISLLIVYLLKGDLSAPWVMVLKVFSSVFAFVIGVWILYRLIPSSVKQAVPCYETKRWIPSLVTMLFMVGAGVIYNRLDTIMLGIMSDPESVGLYTVALRGADFILIGQQVGAAVLGPHVAGLYARKDTQALQALTTKSVRVIMAYSFPVSLIFIVFGSWFLAIFGSEFTQGHSVLIILCIGKLINASTGAVGLLLNMTHHERDNAIVIGVTAVINVILNSILIPQWQGEGAAIATAVTSIIANVWLAIVVYRRLGINSTILGKIPFIGI